MDSIACVLEAAVCRVCIAHTTCRATNQQGAVFGGLGFSYLYAVMKGLFPASVAAISFMLFGECTLP